MNYDKQITRWARSGVTSVLLYGKHWPLRRGGFYRVKFNRRAPGKSEVVEVAEKGGP